MDELYLQAAGQSGLEGDFDKLTMKEYVFMSRLAETAENYGDMVEFITNVIRVKGDGISKEERNLLSTAFK